MPQISNSTRWNSQEACVSTFLNNFYKYQEIMNTHICEFDKSICQILNNNGLYRDSLNLQKQLKLVASVLDKVTCYLHFTIFFKQFFMIQFSESNIELMFYCFIGILNFHTKYLI